MRKNILSLLPFLCLILMQCQKKDQKVLVNEDSFEGVLFTEEFEYTYPDGFVAKSGYYVTGSFMDFWTPELEDIYTLEENFIVYNDTSLNFTELRKYFRQYVGYINISGEQTIWVNFVALDDLRDQLLELPLGIQDADTLVFSINYNVQDSSFYDLRFY